jgi:hypothetical protein
MTTCMDLEEKMAVVELFYETYATDPAYYSNMGFIQFSEIVLEKLQAPASTSSSREQPIKKSKLELIFMNLLDSEIRMSNIYIEKLKKKKKSIQSKKWKRIQIKDARFYVMEGDCFAYKSLNITVPDYFWDGKRWSPVAAFI